MDLGRVKNITVWSLFSFACTIYSINIISLYFALWVTVDKQGPDIYYSLAFSTSVFLAAIVSPLIGYFSDRLHRRVPFLVVTGLGCFLGTAVLGFTNNLSFALIVFTLTNFCYQSADVIQNMLIPQITAGKNVGRVAGFGAGFGYLGVIAGVMLVSPIVTHYGRHAAFLPTALLFLLFSLPSFLVLKDPQVQSVRTPPPLKEVFLKPIHTLINIKRYPDLGVALLAIFLAFNSIDTVFVFMSVYLKKVIGFVDGEFTLFYVACSVFAILSGIVGGFIVDKIGAKRVLTYSIMLWCFALLLAMVSHAKLVFWMVGALVGISLGATWTSSKTLVVALAPKEQIGEFFGFYGLVIKIAAIIGPLIWGVSVSLGEGLGIFKYRVTIGILLLVLLTGLIVLRKVESSIYE